METITLEQMYYIGEIIAAVAVIASLLYVGKQLQQNAESLQASQRQTTLNADMQHLFKIVDNPKLALARIKSELTDEEKIQVFYMAAIYLRMRELDWIQYQNGALDKATWSTYQTTIKGMLSNTNTRVVWQNNSQLFDQGFVAHINELIADLPITDKLIALKAFD